jgi:hypothetical protein
MATYQLSMVGKLFIAHVIAWIVHDVKLNWKVRGDKDKVTALATAIIASKKFQDELKKPGATVDSVIERLNVKNMTSKDFERITGMPFPL